MESESNKIGSQRLDRRAAIKWMMAAATTLPFLDTEALGQGGPAISTPKGHGFDPNLLSPGELPWKLTFNKNQLKTLSALTDLILPQVGESPSASELKVPDFIDEWVSAPYEYQSGDKKIVLEALKWMDDESRRRFKKRFFKLAESEQTAICDDICNLPTAKPEFKEGARYFAKIRNLTMGGYYTTDVGAREVGYVGNVPLPAFNGPPKEVLDFLGVDKAPW